MGRESFKAGGKKKYEVGDKRGHLQRWTLSDPFSLPLSFSLPRTWLCPGPLPAWPLLPSGSPLSGLLPVLPPSPLPYHSLSTPTGPASQHPSCPQSPQSCTSQGPPYQAPRSGTHLCPSNSIFRLPLLARLAQGAEERLRLWSLRPEGLEVKPETRWLPGRAPQRGREPSTGEKAPHPPVWRASKQCGPWTLLNGEEDVKLGEVPQTPSVLLSTSL